MLNPKKQHPVIKQWADYQAACNELGITQLEATEWALISALLDENHIPYTSSTGNTWVHDMRKKTLRTDTPYQHFLMKSLRASPSP
jgi:hypothetical protein